MIKKLGKAFNRLLIKNARVLDVEKGELSPPQKIIIEKGIIRETGTEAEPDCDSIDLDGLTLSPGLIDCHVHILSPYLTEQKGIPGLWTLKQMERNCRATLAAGVVCVCDMLSPIKILNRVRRKIESGNVDGPDIIASGGIFSCAGGYPEAISPVAAPIGAVTGQPKYEPRTPAQAKRLVNYLYNLGAGVIKVGYTRLSRQLVDGRTLPAISDENLRAVCNAAHELGLKVRVHHNWSEDMNHLITFDIDTLEHGVYDRTLLDEEIQDVKESGVSIVPTLTINDSQARFEEKLGFLKSNRAKEYFEPEALRHLTWVCSTWTDFSGESYGGSFGYTRANRYCYDAELNNTRNLFEAGVKLYAGTDTGAVVAWPGELADELIRLNSIGMSPLQAVRAATAEAAELVGRPDLGIVKNGKTASFTVIEGNPLDDLSAYKKVRYVCKSGKWYKPLHDQLPDFWSGYDVHFKLR